MGMAPDDPRKPQANKLGPALSEILEQHGDIQMVAAIGAMVKLGLTYELVSKEARDALLLALLELIAETAETPEGKIH